MLQSLFQLWLSWLSLASAMPEVRQCRGKPSQKESGQVPPQTTIQPGSSLCSLLCRGGAVLFIFAVGGLVHARRPALPVSESATGWPTSGVCNVWRSAGPSSVRSHRLFVHRSGLYSSMDVQAGCLEWSSAHWQLLCMSVAAFCWCWAPFFSCHTVSIVMAKLGEREREHGVARLEWVGGGGEQWR